MAARFNTTPLKVAAFCFVTAVLFSGCAGNDLVDEGDWYFDAARYENAVSSYERASAQSPGDAGIQNKIIMTKERAADILYLKARLLCYEGDFEEGLKVLSSALEYSPSHAEARRLFTEFSALLTRMNKDLDAARALLDAGKPGEARSILYNTKAYAGTNRKVAEYYENATKVYIESLLAGAKKILEEGRAESALGLVGAALKISPADERALKLKADAEKSVIITGALKKADAHIKLKEYFEAMEAYREIQAIDPENAKAKEGLGKVREEGPAALFDEGDRASRSGNDLLALRCYARAGALGGDRVETHRRQAAVRKKALVELVNRASNMEVRGFSAAALVMYIAARQLGSDDSSMDDSVKRTRSKIELEIRNIIEIKDFRDLVPSGPGPRIGAELAVDLNQRYALSRISFINQEEAAARSDAGREVKPTAVVRGWIEKFYVVEKPPRYVSKKKEYTRQEYSETAGHLVVVPQVYNYREMYRKKTAEARARYIVTDIETGKQVAEGAVEVERTEEDRVVQGNAEALVEDDPDAIPTNEEMISEMTSRLIEQLARRISEALSTFHERYVDLARSARKSGDWRRALDYYVRFLYLTGALEGSFSAPGGETAAETTPAAAREKALSTRDPETAREIRAFLLEYGAWDVDVMKALETYLPVRGE
jgi:tetratricopeptide (TPR) repeat protein